MWGKFTFCLEENVLEENLCFLNKHSYRTYHVWGIVINILHVLLTTLIKILWGWASLVVQWSRICLPMQGTCVQSQVGEDPTCQGAAKPVAASTEARAPEPVLHKRSPTVRSPRSESESSLCSLQTRQPACSNEDPEQSKIKKLKNIKKNAYEGLYFYFTVGDIETQSC